MPPLEAFRHAVIYIAYVLDQDVCTVLELHQGQGNHLPHPIKLCAPF